MKDDGIEMDERDRRMIAELSDRYSIAVSTQQFAELDYVFTADAFLDFTGVGGIAGPYGLIREWLACTRARHTGIHHMTVAQTIVVSGRVASGRSVCLAPLVSSDNSASGRVEFYGLRNHDKYRRTNLGWRMTYRRQSRAVEILDPTDHNVGPDPQR